MRLVTNDTPPLPLVLTVLEVAGLLRVSTKTVYRSLAADTFPVPARRIQGQYRFSSKAVMAYLENPS